MPNVFFTDSTTTEIYTLSLHDALPISSALDLGLARLMYSPESGFIGAKSFFLEDILHDRAKQLVIVFGVDRKSTRLNSSHVRISYAVFCLKKKKKITSTLLLIKKPKTS